MNLEIRPALIGAIDKKHPFFAPVWDGDTKNIPDGHFAFAFKASHRRLAIELGNHPRVIELARHLNGKLISANPRSINLAHDTPFIDLALVRDAKHAAFSLRYTRAFPVWLPSSGKTILHCLKRKLNSRCDESAA